MPFFIVLKYTKSLGYRIILCLFIGVQLYFVWASIFSVSNKSYWGSHLIGISLVLLLSYYQQKKLHLPAPEKLPLELLPVFFSATLLTFGLQDFLHFNAVLAAGCIGFLG